MALLAKAKIKQDLQVGLTQPGRVYTIWQPDKVGSTGRRACLVLSHWRMLLSCARHATLPTGLASTMNQAGMSCQF